MDIDRFARLTRAVSTLLSRRTLAGTLSLSVLGLPSLADAKKKHKKRKKRKKKVKFNAFGCVDVEKFCNNGRQCCSGICNGEKGKKTCKAHDASTCQPGQDVCAGVVATCVSAAGENGACVRTTGNAGYCQVSAVCRSCTKDIDCQATCGPQAACIVCEVDCGPNGTGCVGPSEESCAA